MKKEKLLKIIDEFTGKRSASWRWKQRNKDRHLKSNKQYYYDWKESIGEESALRIRTERNKKSRKKNPEQYLLYEAKSRAKKKGLEFSLTEIVIPKVCPVLGIPIFKNSNKNGPADNSASIDRIDSTKGYTPENSKVISWRANKLKQDSTIEELEKVLNYMRNYL